MAQIPREFKDFAFPKATVSRLIKEAQGLNPTSQQKISQFAINVLSGLFSLMLSNQAITITHSRKKKTVNEEAVIEAIESLGFGDLGAIVKKKMKELEETAMVVVAEEKKEEELEEDELIELDEDQSPLKLVREIEDQDGGEVANVTKQELK